MNKEKNNENELRILEDGIVVHTIKGYSGQHYYPHSLADYALAIKKYINGDITHLPIMAVDCHDCYACDFKCQDCLADETKKWFKENLGAFSDYSKDFEGYKRALKKIADYSSESGEEHVRFEMSGEGNPDLYPYREEIIKYASELGMRPVYITSGSKLNEKLMETLAQYASYIRISLPGLSNESYIKYSGQNKFLFDDAVLIMKKLVALRNKFGREDSLLIGARCCLRPETAERVELISNILLNQIGIDTFQVVRAIKNNNEGGTIEQETIPVAIREKIESLRQCKGVVIPDDLSTYYNERINSDGSVSRCWTSKMTPILYNNYLIPCTHTRIIKDLECYIQGNLEENNIPNFKMNPNYCITCCAIKDNQVLEEIYDITKKIIKAGKDVSYECV